MAETVENALVHQDFIGGDEVRLALPVKVSIRRFGARKRARDAQGRRRISKVLPGLAAL